MRMVRLPMKRILVYLWYRLFIWGNAIAHVVFKSKKWPYFDSKIYGWKYNSNKLDPNIKSYKTRNNIKVNRIVPKDFVFVFPKNKILV